MDAPATSSATGQRVIRGGALSFAGGLIAGVGGFLLTVVVARGLGAEQAGVFFVSLGLFTILSNALELGADTGLVRAIPRLRALGRPADISRTLIVATVPVLVVGCIAAVLVSIYAPTLARVFMTQGNSVHGASFLRTVAPYLAFASVATVLAAGTRGFGSVVPYVSIQNIGLPLLRPLAIGVLVTAGIATERSVAAAWGLPLVAAALIAAGLVVRSTRRLGTAGQSATEPRPLPALAGEFWAFAGARAFGGVAEIMLIWLDVLLVGWLVGPLEAGVYAAASRFITTGTLVLQATRIAITPQLSRLLATERTSEAEALFNGGAQAVVAASWPLYLGLACFSPAILRVFGRHFTSGATSLTILSLAMLVDTATGNIGSVLLMAGRSRWNVVNATSALAVDVIIDLLLIPHHGATGAAIGWAAAIVVLNVLACLEVHYLMGLQIFDRATIRTAILAGLCFGAPGVVLGLLEPRLLWPPAAWLVIGGACYVAWWWRRRNDPEIRLLLDALGVSRLLNLRPATDHHTSGPR